MSAGFSFADRVCWGTNGAVETYLEALSQLAAERLGPDDRLSMARRAERDGFYTGAVIYLDDFLTEPGDRERFVRFLDEATEGLLREQIFSEKGREWVATEVRALRDQLAAADPLAADA